MYRGNVTLLSLSFIKLTLTKWLHTLDLLLNRSANKNFKKYILRRSWAYLGIELNKRKKCSKLYKSKLCFYLKKCSKYSKYHSSQTIHRGQILSSLYLVPPSLFWGLQSPIAKGYSILLWNMKTVFMLIKYKPARYPQFVLGLN